jgi:phospholipid-transporting ATPase
MIWFKIKSKSHLYLETGDENAGMIFFLRFGNWILIFGNFVPISLIVTVETVKYLQA